RTGARTRLVCSGDKPVTGSVPLAAARPSGYMLNMVGRGEISMIETTQSMTVGAGGDAREIAMLLRAGNRPGLFWLGGFRSDMMGSKAQALDALGAERELAVTRFDYSGHGASGGQFLEGTISRWLEEALAVFETT